jgi:hypothetical protein
MYYAFKTETFLLLMKKKETKRGGRLNKNKSTSSQTGENVVSLEVDISPKLTPYDIFQRCIKRAQNLIDFHTDEKGSEIEENFCDAYRAAIVLSISALDAFIRSIVTEKINVILINDSEELTEKLATYLKNLLNQDKLLLAARKYNLHEVVDKHIKEDFGTKSFQGEWKIKTFMELVGYQNIFKQVSDKADISESNLMKKLELYTKRRHVIAHSGDYDLNSTEQKENAINKKFAVDCVYLVNKFAKHVNEICQKK